MHACCVSVKVAEEKLEDHRRLNCPELRQLESRQMQRAVEEDWKEQIGKREKVRSLKCWFVVVSTLCWCAGDGICEEREGRVSCSLELVLGCPLLEMLGFKG